MHTYYIVNMHICAYLQQLPWAPSSYDILWMDAIHFASRHGAMVETTTFVGIDVGIES